MGRCRGGFAHLKQAHAFATTGNQDALRVATFQQSSTRLVQFRLCMNRRTQRQFCLRLVGRQRGHTLKTEERTMRVNHHNLIVLSCHRNTDLDNIAD